MNICGLLTEKGDEPCGQWREVRAAILKDEGVADILGGIDSSLTKRGIDERLQDASGKPCPKFNHAKRFIDEERRTGEYTTDGKRNYCRYVLCISCT